MEEMLQQKILRSQEQLNSSTRSTHTAQPHCCLSTFSSSCRSTMSALVFGLDNSKTKHFLFFLGSCLVPCMIFSDIKWGTTLQNQTKTTGAPSLLFLLPAGISGTHSSGGSAGDNEEKNVTYSGTSISSVHHQQQMRWWKGIVTNEDDCNKTEDSNPVASSLTSSPTGGANLSIVSKLCPNEDLSNGRWINVTYDAPPYIPMKGEVQQKTCPDFEPSKPFQTFIWEPTAVHTKGCNFASFDPNSFCQVSFNKTIAIIGDSTSFDHYLSLSHLLGVPQALPRARSRNAMLVSNVCQNKTLLIGKRDFYLDSVGHIIEGFFPDVLILNRGAHYVRDEDLIRHMNQTVFPELYNWQQKCHLHERNCMLIWRTSVPGHPNCTKYKEPSESLEAMEQLVHEHGSVYHWDQFKIQNQLVLDAFQKAAVHAASANSADGQLKLVYEVMDAYSVNILRPDMHPGPHDCLHTVRLI